MNRNLLAAALVIAALVPLGAQAQTAKKKKAKKQKQETAYTPVETPALASAGDSTAYVFGISQSKGLETYMRSQLNVDSTYTADFVEGILQRVSADPADKQQHAFNAGVQVGEQIEKMAQSFSKDYYAAEPGRTVDPKIVAAGIIQGLLRQNTISADSAMQQFRATMAERQQHNQEVLYGGNRTAGELFLKQNKQQPGVVTLPSGLQYKILKQGTGPVPTATQTVKVNYEGHLIDGTEFDSSYKRNQPASFQANRVIKGWTEALTKMPVGSTWQLFIPQELAYGDRATGKIKPYSALIFTVELLGIEDKK